MESGLSLLSTLMLPDLKAREIVLFVGHCMRQGLKAKMRVPGLILC